MKRILILGGILLVLLAALLVAVYVALPQLVGRVGPAIAADYGLQVSEVMVGRPRLRSMPIEVLRLQADGSAIEAVDGVVTYTLAGLLRGEFETLVFASASLSIAAEGSSRIRADSGAEPSGALPTADSTPDLGALFGLLPFTGIHIDSLALAVPEVGFQGLGRVALSGDRLEFSMAGLEPEVARSLIVAGAADAAGHIDLAFEQPGNTAGAFLALQSELQESGVKMAATLDLSGYPLDLVSSITGLPAGTGVVRATMTTLLPWPVTDVALEALSATGEFSVTWADAAGSVDLEGLQGSVSVDGAAVQTRFSAGLVSYADDEQQASFVIPSGYLLSATTRHVSASGALPFTFQGEGVAVRGALSQVAVDLGEAMDLRAQLDGHVNLADYHRELEVGARLQLTGGVDGQLEGAGSVSTAGFEVPFALLHNLAAGSGNLTATGALTISAPLAADLLPDWSEPYDLDGGPLDYEIEASWTSEGAIDGHALISLDGVNAHYEDYLFDAVSGQLPVSFDAEAFAIEPTEMTVGSVDVGVALRNLKSVVEFADEVASLRETSFEVLGGRAVVSDFDYDLNDENTAFDILLDGVSLKEVLALEGENIGGHGTMSGRLPVTIRAGEPSVTGGRISAVAPGGAIRLSPDFGAVTGQPGLDFAMTALTNYQFTTLDASVDYAEDGELALGISLQGRNPEVEQGRPIHYNLNVTENVLVLLESLRAQRAVTEGLERRVLR